jgi:hypothetical protein
MGYSYDAIATLATSNQRKPTELQLVQIDLVEKRGNGLVLEITTNCDS